MEITLKFLRKLIYGEEPEQGLVSRENQLKSGGPETVCSKRWLRRKKIKELILTLRRGMSILCVIGGETPYLYAGGLAQTVRMPIRNCVVTNTNLSKGEVTVKFEDPPEGDETK